jgi:hypothetical protein
VGSKPAKLSQNSNHFLDKLSNTQNFKIGEDFSGIENKVFEKTKLPALNTYKYFSSIYI